MATGGPAAVAAFCLLVLVPFGVRAELESTLALEMFAADKTQSGIVTDVRRELRSRRGMVDVADVELRNGREVVIEGHLDDLSGVVAAPWSSSARSTSVPSRRSSARAAPRGYRPRWV